MNDKGDFYIGNTKISSSSGQQSTFDIPIPTITGEDPNRLSLVADEVIVKERILVEGGTSKQILSQFDGPVTFNENVRLANPNARLTVEGDIRAQSAKFRDTTQATSINSGAVEIDGGLGVAKNIWIGGNFKAQNHNTSNIGTNTVRFANVYAVNFHGDGTNLTNTGAQLSEPTSGTQRVVLTDKTSGTMTTAATEEGLQGNNLTYNFTSHTLTSSNFTGNLTGNVTGNATSADSVTITAVGAGTFSVMLASSSGSPLELHRDGGISFTNPDNLLEVEGGVRGHNVRMGVTQNNQIDSTSGNLRLVAASGTVNVASSNNLQVTGNLITQGDNTLGNGAGDDTTVSGRLYVNHGDDATATNDGTVRVTGGISCTKSLFVGEKIRAGDDIIAFNTSDISLKDNITPIPNSLDKILSLSGNIFSWNSKSDYNGTDDIGILAQEVEALGLPGITKTRENGNKAVRYDRLIPILIEAVKELTAKVKSLESNK